MSVLHLKLLRDLARLWAQALAIAMVVAAGVATLIIGVGAYDSLSSTRARYYEANAFADIFATATRAPNDLVANIAAIPGVAVAEGRITEPALLDLDDMAQPGSALLVSLPDLRPQALDKIYMRTGRLPQPESEDEVVINEPFALAHHFGPGASFRVLMNGTLRTVRVTGIALSPEFIYAQGPGDILPDPSRFGILWMSEKTLAAAYNLKGAFSSLQVKLITGASQDDVIQAIDARLARYGGQGAYGRSDQRSNAFLDSELIQLRGISLLLPPIFLLVAAFLVNMTLGRMIALEREQIGLLKALGYSDWSVALHYMEFAALISLLGAAIGVGAGIYFGTEITQLYAKFYNFPFLVFSRNPTVYGAAAGITFAAAIAGAVRAATGAARLPPATAMLPPAPPHYNRRLSGWIEVGGVLSQSAVMTARHLLHWPWRTAGGVLGVAMAVAVLTGSMWTFGATDALINYTFYQSARQDASIGFSGPKPLSALFAVARLPGILHAEPFRAVSVIIRHGPIERRTGLMGQLATADLTRVVDARGALVDLPASGLVISSALARILGVQQGDTVAVSLLEGDRRTVDVPISATIESYLGLTAFMNFDALNRLLGEGEMISGVNVSVDNARETQLFSALKATPSASAISLQRVSLQRYRDTLAANISVMITIYVSFAGIIAFGVIYSFARISLSEQGREFASLRVLGFSTAEVSALLLGEIGIVVLIAQPIGWLIGLGVARLAADSFSTELYRVPLVVGPEVYATASLVSITAAIISGFVVRRRIDRLDMIAVLKTRE